jgi:hypothetical protein
MTLIRPFYVSQSIVFETTLPFISFQYSYDSDWAKTRIFAWIYWATDIFFGETNNSVPLNVVMLTDADTDYTPKKYR